MLAGAWLAAGLAQAGSIEISPVRSDLSAAVRVGVLTVRVGLRDAATEKVEAVYRLVIEEVPALQEQETTRMRLVVRHDLPVFVAPVAPGVPMLDIAMECGTDGAHLRLNNVGNLHPKVLRLTLLEPTTSTMQGDWKTFQYLLPG